MTIFTIQTSSRPTTDAVLSAYSFQRCAPDAEVARRLFQMLVKVLLQNLKGDTPQCCSGGIRICPAFNLTIYIDTR